MTKIFISYARKDGDELAEHLHERLTACGFDVWKDSHDLGVGKNFPGAISDALQQTKEFILLVSPSALQSEWVNDEVNMAMAARCRILPLVFAGINNNDIPLMLSTKNYILTKGINDWESLNKLVDNLEGGKDIPRVINLSGHKNIEVKGVLVLGHSEFGYVDLADPRSIIETAQKMAGAALPYIEANAGIVPHGHPALASAILAFLLGAVNQMPKLFYTYKTESGNFGISNDKVISLQSIRDSGFEFRSRK